MSIQIKLKNSVVQDSTPSASDLPEVGELAVNGNINSIGGFMRASDNTIVKIFGPGSVTTPTATTTVSGISELATNTETTTGTATNRVVTPAGLNAVTVAERTTSNTNYVAKAGSTLTGVLTMPNGSNSAPAINFGDSDSGIFGGTNTVSLAAGGTTRLTADTGVSVVGTLAVTGAITSTSDLTIADKIIHSGDTNTAIRFPAADTVSVETGGNEAFRVDSSQRLLVGTSTARSPQGITPSLQIEGTDVHSSSISITRNSTDNASAALIFNKSRGATVGSDVVVQDNDVLGIVYFTANDGTDSDNSAATITAEVDGTPGSNDTPGRLKFSTTADGAANPTERMRIDSSGVIEAKTRSAEVRRMILAGSPSNSAFNIEAHDGETGSSAGDVQGKLGLFYNDGSTLNNTANLSFIRGSGAPDGAIAFVTNQTERMRIDSAGLVKLPDNGKFVAGTGEDLQIYHDGNHSRIDDTGTGSLVLRSSNFLVEKYGGDYMIHGVADGAVELYYDGSKKFETTSSGGLVTGQLLASSGFKVNDGVHITLGTDNDFKLYHDGSNAAWLNTTGNNYLYGSGGNFFIRPVNGESSIDAIANGAVNLYFDNSKKLETTSAGTKNTGVFDCTGSILLTDQSGDNIGKLRLGNGPDLEIYHDGTNSVVHNDNGSMIIENDASNANSIFIKAKSGEHSIIANHNGAVELYHDNSKKFETTSTGISVAGNGVFTGNVQINDNNFLNVGNSGDLQIYHQSSDNNSYIVEGGSGSLMIQGDIINLGNVGTSEYYIRCFENGSVQLRHDNSTKIETTSTGVSFANGADATTSKLILALGNASTKEATIQGYSTSTNEKGIVFKTYNFASRTPLTLTPGGHLNVPDNSKLQMGDSQDLQIFHDGNNSVINNDTGGLYIKNDGVIEFQKASSGETKAKFISDGAVELYFDNNKKFHTTSTGAYITGGIIINGGANWFIVDAGTGSADSYRATTAGGIMHFFSNVGGTRTMKSYINENGVLTSASDYRLKTDIAEVTNGISIVKDLKPSTYKWKHDSTTTHHGFIAHELQTVLPNCIDGDKDGVKSDGTTPHYQFYSDQELVPVLTAALKEAITKIETLETKVAALEAA